MAATPLDGMVKDLPPETPPMYTPPAHWRQAEETPLQYTPKETPLQYTPKETPLQYTPRPGGESPTQYTPRRGSADTFPQRTPTTKPSLPYEYGPVTRRSEPNLLPSQRSPFPAAGMHGALGPLQHNSGLVRRDTVVGERARNYS